MATICATCHAGAPQLGANAGDIIANPPTCPASAAQKLATIPATNTAAKAICARHAAERRQFMAAETAIAAVESRMCPRRTSCPAMLSLTPNSRTSPNARRTASTRTAASIQRIATYARQRNQAQRKPWSPPNAFDVYAYAPPGPGLRFIMQW